MIPFEVMDEYVLGRLDAGALPHLATQLLLMGADTLAMAEAAMPDTNDPREIRDLFETALRSENLSIPSWEAAAESWLRREARAVLAGDRTLDEAARRICDTFAWPGDAERLPRPYVDVVVSAGEDEEPYWREALERALTMLVRVLDAPPRESRLARLRGRQATHG